MGLGLRRPRPSPKSTPQRKDSVWFPLAILRISLRLKKYMARRAQGSRPSRETGLLANLTTGQTGEQQVTPCQIRQWNKD